jgi:hypothetical protein
VYLLGGQAEDSE